MPDSVLVSVIRADDRFIAVGSLGGQDDSVWESNDGLVWRELARRPFGKELPWSIIATDGGLIALARRPLGDGTQTSAWRSADGVAWERWIEPEGSRHPRSFVRFQERWLMQSVHDAGISVSKDGNKWTRVAKLEASEAAGFAMGPGGVVAGYTVDNPTSFQAAAYFTRDGDQWSQALLDDGGIAMLDRVGANRSMFVALGRARLPESPFTGAAWWSFDGTNWQRAAMPSAFTSAEWHARSVASLGESFVALVQLGLEGQVGLLWSSDGRTWTFQEPMPQISLNDASLVVTDGRLLVYGTELDDVAAGVVWEGSISR